VLAKGDENGVVVTQGGLFGGYALLLKAAGQSSTTPAERGHFEIAATDALTAGRHTVVSTSSTTAAVSAWRHRHTQRGRSADRARRVDEPSRSASRSTRPSTSGKTLHAGQRGYDVPKGSPAKWKRSSSSSGRQLSAADERALLEMERTAGQATH